MNNKYVKISGLGNSIGIVFNTPIQLINYRSYKYTKIGFYHWNQDIVETQNDFDFSDEEPEEPKELRISRMVKESNIEDDVKQAMTVFSKKLDLNIETTKKIEKNIVKTSELQNKQSKDIKDIKGELKISNGLINHLDTYKEIHCNIVQTAYHPSKNNQFGDLIDCDDQLLAISKPNSNVIKPIFMPILEGLREIKNISIEIKDCVDSIVPNGIPQSKIITQNVFNTIVLILK